jgi:hypothetical protein
VGRYFGSADSDLIARRAMTFTIRREIIWESDTASDSEVSAMDGNLGPAASPARLRTSCVR